MTHRSGIPKRPTELPQQRLYLVKGVPTAPPGWAPLDNVGLDTYRKARVPRSARYLGQIEWACSPANSRISAYCLAMDRRRRHWLLWLKPVGADDPAVGAGHRAIAVVVCAHDGRKWLFVDSQGAGERAANAMSLIESVHLGGHDPARRSRTCSSGCPR